MSEIEATKNLEQLTEAESELYDRQIRLWGLDAQRRLRAANVLLAGIRGLGAEVAKNVVLAGVKSLTLLDHTDVTEEDKCSNFLVDRASIGYNRAEKALKHVQQLNPMVNVHCDPENVAAKTDAFFKQFDVVCLMSCPLDVYIRVDSLCREYNIKFYAGDVFGMYGFMFADLGVHEYAQSYVKKVKKPTTANPSATEEITTVVKQVSTFQPLTLALQYDWSSEKAKKKLKRASLTYFVIRVLLKFLEKHSRRPDLTTQQEDQSELLKIRDETMEEMGLPPNLAPDSLTQNCFAELSPVCAVVGGVLAQEIIKAVSQKDTPHNNFFFFDGQDGNGIVDYIGE